MKRVLYIFIGVMVILSCSITSFSDETPITGSITIKTEAITKIAENGSDINVYEPTVYGSYGETNDTRLFVIFPAEPGFNKDNSLVGVVYKCTDAQKAVEGFSTYFTAGADNSVTATEAAMDEDGSLTPEAVQWIEDHLDSLKITTLKRSAAVGGGNYMFNSDGSIYANSYSSSMNLPKIVVDRTKGELVFTRLPFAYYFIDSSFGAVAMLTTTAPDVIIEEKNDTPQLEKTITQITNADGSVTNPDGEVVSEDIQPVSADIQPGTHQVSPGGNARDNHAATVQYGDTVDFSVHITARKGAESYVVYDNMSDGLTLIGDSIHILSKGVAESGEPAELDETNYTLDISNPRQIYLSFKQSYLDTITEETNIYLNYKCVINGNSTAAWDGGYYNGYSNCNNVYFSWGRDGKRHLDDTNKYYTARLKVFKYEGEGDSSSSAGNRGLPGVKFILKNAEGKYFTQDETTKAIHWVEGKNNAQELVTGGNPDFVSQTTTETGTYYLNSFIYSTPQGPFVGPDGEMGTSDDYYTCLGPDNGTVTFIIGPNLQPGNGDDTVRYIPASKDRVMTITSGPDGEWGTGNEEVTTVTMDPDVGVITIDGLTNGTYTLIEKEALPGYNEAEPIEIVINNQNNTFEELRKQVNVANKTGSVLPSTGGSGTTIFYAIGAMLLIGSGVILNEKRRRKAA